MSTPINARGNIACDSHVECIPGGLHPLDTLEHLTPLSPEQLANIERVRLSKDGLGPTLPYARLPETVTEATAVYGRFQTFHRVFPRPWHIEIRHRVKTNQQLHNLFGFEILKFKTRLKLWKPTVRRCLVDHTHLGWHA